MRAPTLVVLSEVKWRYMRTRKQYLLTAWPRGWRTIFFEPFAVGRPNRILPTRDGDVTYVTVPFPKAGSTSGTYNALLELPVVRGLQNLLCRVWIGVLLLWLGAAGARDRILLVSNVLVWPVARRLRRRCAVYDMNDDPAGFHPSIPWVADYARATLQGVDLVVACSRGLARRAREGGARDVTVIGNGVNADVFRGGGTEPDPLAAYPRPRLGYLGAIGPWVDFALVEQVARAFPHAAVVFIGPVQPAVRDRMEELTRSCGNVAPIGEIPFTDVPRHVRALDVCLIPFHRSPQTDVLNPNKLYEYFAAGRTVVTLDYSEEIRALADCLYLAGDAGEFVSAVGRALAAPIEAERLRAVAEKNSWTAKARDYAALLARHAGGTEEEDRS